MTSRTLWVPAFDADEAREIAHAVDAGRMGHIEHYVDQDAAHRVCAHLNRLGSKRREVFKVTIRDRATHDGFIPVAWPVDRVGDVAAALTLFALIPLVGLASMWEVFA